VKTIVNSEVRQLNVAELFFGGRDSINKIFGLVCLAQAVRRTMKDVGWYLNQENSTLK
jgi:hypothetical protein